MKMRNDSDEMTIMDEKIKLLFGQEITRLRFKNLLWSICHNQQTNNDNICGQKISVFKEITVNQDDQ